MNPGLLAIYLCCPHYAGEVDSLVPCCHIITGWISNLTYNEAMKFHHAHIRIPVSMILERFVLYLDRYRIVRGISLSFKTLYILLGPNADTTFIA